MELLIHSLICSIKHPLIPTPRTRGPDVFIGYWAQLLSKYDSANVWIVEQNKIFETRLIDQSPETISWSLDPCESTWWIHTCSSPPSPHHQLVAVSAPINGSNTFSLSLESWKQRRRVEEKVCKCLGGAQSSHFPHSSGLMVINSDPVYEKSLRRALLMCYFSPAPSSYHLFF